jgi:iron-sulfur cluster assembly enzyme ISCU, mitochondrial
MLLQTAKSLLDHSQTLTRLAVAPVRRYHEAVLDHYNKPRNVGSFDKSDPNVGTGLVGAPACGGGLN